MTIAVVDSGGANISSVLHALHRLGVEPEFTADAGKIRLADKVILPGVGAAGRAMEILKENGLVELIREVHERGWLHRDVKTGEPPPRYSIACVFIETLLQPISASHARSVRATAASTSSTSASRRGGARPTAPT